MVGEEERYCCCQWHIKVEEVPCSDCKPVHGADFAELQKQLSWRWHFLPVLGSTNREAFTALILLSFLFAWWGIKECLFFDIPDSFILTHYVFVVSYSAILEEWWSTSQNLCAFVYFIVLQKQKIGNMNKEENVCLQAYRHKMNTESCRLLQTFSESQIFTWILTLKCQSFKIFLCIDSNA